MNRRSFFKMVTGFVAGVYVAFAPSKGKSKETFTYKEIIGKDIDGTLCKRSGNDHNELSYGDGANDSAFSIAAWIYVTGGGLREILSKWDATVAAEAREWRFYLNTNEEIYFVLCDESANAHQVLSTQDALTSGWHLVVATYDGRGGDDATDGMAIYIDNSAVSTTVLDIGTYVAMENTATKVVIGASYNDAGNLDHFWDEKIDNVMLFNSELTIAQVAGLW